MLGLNVFLAACVAQRYPLLKDPNHYAAVALAAFLNIIYDQIFEDPGVGALRGEGRLLRLFLLQRSGVVV